MSGEGLKCVCVGQGRGGGKPKKRRKEKEKENWGWKRQDSGLGVMCLRGSSAENAVRRATINYLCRFKV